MDWCATVTLDPAQLAKKPGEAWTGRRSRTSSAHDLNWAGWVTAVDADTGQVKWRFKAGAPVLSGITPTKGGLVFAGDMDKHAYAFDAATGKILWRDRSARGARRRRDHVFDRRQAARRVCLGHALAAFPVSPSSARIQFFGL